LGASAYSVAVFHLMTHAFFKALLFLAAGSVIMGVHHNQDIRWMGGLRKYMPMTWITALLGLAGADRYTHCFPVSIPRTKSSWRCMPAVCLHAGFAYFAVMAGVFITAFYSFRMYFLVFHGKERFDQNPDSHHGHGHDGGHGAPSNHPHESPWVVTLPLVLLAIPSVVIGFMTVGPMLFGDFFKDAIFVNAEIHRACLF
jgi:NADH-quinone oxidoreductase subunit L